MKINWKVRIKNIQFWIAVAAIVLGQVFSYYGISGADLTTWKSVWELIVNFVSNPFILVSTLIAVYVAILDPTTPGISDSKRALQYDKPGGETK